jgi:hypothetical protein
MDPMILKSSAALLFFLCTIYIIMKLIVAADILIPGDMFLTGPERGPGEEGVPRSRHPFFETARYGYSSK